MDILIKKQDVNPKIIKKENIKEYNDPIFKEIDETLYLDPIIASFIKKQTEILWTVEEIVCNSSDLELFKTLDEDYKILIKSIVLYFLFADKIVGDNISNLKASVPYKSAKYFYNLQAYVEDIHDRAYELSCRLYYDNDEKFIKDKNLMEQIIATAEYYPDEEFDINNYESDYYNTLTTNEKKIFQAVSVKLNLLNKWKNINSIVYNLVSFITIESVSFNILFVIINLFKGYNKGLKYLIDINEMVSRDENIHAVFGIVLYNNFVLEKLSMYEIIYIVTDITNTEITFIETIMNTDFKIGNYTRNRFVDYLKNTANKILGLMHIPDVYQLSDNIPEEFNIQTSLIKTNFFERPSLYVSNNKIVDTKDVLNMF